MTPTRRLAMRISGAGLTAKELAERLGISDKTLRTYIYGTSHYAVLGRMVEELDLTPADLWAIVTGRELTFRELQKMRV